MLWLALLLCHVAWCDMRQRRIPNADVLLLWLLGAGSALAGASPFQVNFVQAMGGSAAALLALLPFYLVRWMGAGDVKLGIALGTCLGWQLWLPVWTASLVLAVACAVCMRGAHRLSGSAVPQQTRGIVKQRIVPYGAALCAATALVWWKVQ